MLSLTHFLSPRVRSGLLRSTPLLALAALGLSIVVQTGCGNATTDVGIGEDDVNGCHGYGYGYAKKCGPYGGNGP